MMLIPCGHRCFCRKCIVETICIAIRSEAPACPLCRTTIGICKWFRRCTCGRSSGDRRGSASCRGRAPCRGCTYHLLAGCHRSHRNLSAVGSPVGLGFRLYRKLDCLVYRFQWKLANPVNGDELLPIGREQMADYRLRRSCVWS